eukprot:TRINITY_DN3988_c0_g2_i1.p1 TRINITY_DN3988_c0_g2~~TRINITY_DN3988_c0_g2_i1.p1  ORF type:complete len:424 (-),score=79.48 TRINITY_DN3988_c0_g2_i1:217-1488(-)
MHRLRQSPYPMIPVPDAMGIVLQNTDRLPEKVVPISESVGLVLSKDVVAGDPLPPFPASVVDGYALCYEDGVGVFPVIGVVTAGNISSIKVVPGKVAQITTGSAIPDGANAVVMVEETELVDTTPEGNEIIKIKKASKLGQFIRPVGSDVKTGEIVVGSGDVIGSAEVGLMATVGVSEVSVYSPPVVAFLSTGDELVEANQTPKNGQIRDSNRPMLLAAANQLGNLASVIDLGIALDTNEALENQIRSGLEKADILVTSGGVSMGELDLLKPILEKSGKVHFGRLAMKPGKPCTFATLEVNGKKKLIFALPGNPVSSCVCFYLFVVLAIRKMAGYSNPRLPVVKAKLKNKIRLDVDRPEYHRATVSWNSSEQSFFAESTGIQASSRLLSMRTANALLPLPNGDITLEAGTLVDAIMIAPFTTS